MKCPKCNFKNTSVIDSRSSVSLKSIRRRRSCDSCGYRFTTSEEIRIFDVKVEKRNGQIVSFDTDSIERGIRKSFNKRTTDSKKIAQVVQNISEEVGSIEKSPVKTTKIGKIVLKHLKKIDEAAYICFGAMFWNFDNIQDFIALAKEIKKD